jgi:hypothetical protein
LLQDGRLFLPSNDVMYSAWHPHEYCIEQFVFENSSWYFGALVCNPDDAEESRDAGMSCQEKLSFYPIFMSISCLALVATIAIYFSMPELMNLPGRNLVSLCLSLLLAYILLILEQESMVTVDKVSKTICILLGKVPLLIRAYF